MNEVTFLIKAFKREWCVLRLIKSLLKFYPEAKVLVVDDSEFFSEKISALIGDQYIHTSYNVGLSAGRNIGLNKIDSEYFFLLDDDVVFNEKTDVERLLIYMKDNDLDICSVDFKDYGLVSRLFRGKYKIQGKTLRRDMHRQSSDLDFVLNCFLAKTEVVKKIMWDDRIKIGYEHDDFFLRVKAFGGVRIGHCHEVSIDHYPYVTEEYSSIRGGDSEYEAIFKDKYAIDLIVNEGDRQSFVIKAFLAFMHKLNKYWHIGPSC